MALGHLCADKGFKSGSDFANKKFQGFFKSILFVFFHKDIDSKEPHCTVVLITDINYIFVCILIFFLFTFQLYTPGFGFGGKICGR